jgi:cobalt-zinc-cadmium resistance protein CzcA
MGPISTGLGEIYQYVIDVEPEYRNQYSLTDLRTIQDWIVRRQLSGIPGVVEVNTWGGFLKQYEVALDPAQLRSLNISVGEVFRALEANNSVAGGGYIERQNQAYFIRGEGLASSVEDIENIVVERRAGMPIYIKDVGQVGFGHATRFGAITGNGEGEKVLGQVMMLKGANAKAVIEAVKERVDQIQPSLPEGVYINPFLERSELIGRTTHTIAENLILGCLIVIFVVVLLLGNLRSGLVVASVIPLSLLFALTMMYIFGVDANLMSLGAIDFGIIIDGAVIIVEYIAYRVTQQRNELVGLAKAERRSLMDRIASQGASKMMNSAIFGQLIIIIVFIPILSLVGVEGKMFRPMALTFCFALLGAMLLCFTYVPVMAALIIKPTDPDKKTISRRLMNAIAGLYRPTISWALRQRTIVLSFAVLLLAGAIFLFTRMGGEFVPTLDEGDFVIQPVLKTGTSLSETVEAVTQMEQILKEFPEVNQVVTRIGAAEVPTDPMSMEETDVIVTLHPKAEWTSADSKDGLVNVVKEALSARIPGVDFEFTQPIEMRFNELITGVRADLAIKIFGEDLDILYNKALEIQDKIANVPGAADITVEKTAGLPQMSVSYDRRKIARYGLNVAELNDMISMGFAGKAAGMIFEGEKQFDLVVRFDQAHRQDIEDIEKANIMLPNGEQLPLSEFAEITYTTGPAKISRDDTKRRIVVGVNVRDRDLESVVQDAQAIIESQVDLPVGYNISYGGQFENLRAARQRLMVAVPVALVLIFVLLYFAFGSVRDAALIYTAIPLSAVGGILLLYLRGMPFSISAGVGFIALFGIAVLNGIVLIEEFKALKEEGMQDVQQRILEGTQKRLRPVLLTASAAALGFLPMAVSVSAGAEVQRPLATVVVGGLISATVLTLVVLPVLYAWIETRRQKRTNMKSTVITLLLCMGFGVAQGQSQTAQIDLEQAIELAMEQHRGLRASAQKVNQQRQLLDAAYDIDPTQFYYMHDQANIAPNDLPLDVFGVQQSIRFPSVYTAQKQVQEAQIRLAQDELALGRRSVARGVSQAYQSILYWEQLQTEYRYLDSLYTAFARAAETRLRLGESSRLEKVIAENKQKEIQLEIEQIQSEIDQAYVQLNRWIQADSSYTIALSALQPLERPAMDTANHPGLRYYEHQIAAAEEEVLLARRQRLPDLNLEVFSGNNNGVNAERLWGIQLGVGVPIWQKAHKARIQAARTNILAQADAGENYRQQLLARYEMLLTQLDRYQQQLDYYESTGKPTREEILTHAQKAYEAGEINFLQYIQLLDNARSIEINYLKSIFEYNKTVLEMQYLLP